MNNWTEGYLIEVAEIVMGQSPSGDTCNNTGEGYPLLNGPTEFGVKHPSPIQFTSDARKKCQPGDILFCVRGSTTGRMNWADQSYAIGRGLAAIRHREGSYYKYFIRGIMDHNLPILLASATGSTFPNVSRTQLEELEITIPPLPEQKAIAEVLSSLDDKIDLLHRQNKTLEAMAETLFRQWFVEEAEKDWGEFQIRDIAFHLKESVNPSIEPLTKFPHYSLPAYDNAKKPSFESGSSIRSNKYLVKPHTILVSKLNPRFPRVWLVLNTAENAICSTEFQVIKPKDGNLIGFVYFLLISDDAVAELEMAASGTSGSHQRVKPDDIFNIKFYTPGLDYLHKFSSIVQPFIEKVKKNRLQIATLEKLRDIMLPKLMNGVIKINY